MYRTLLVPVDLGDVETAQPALDRAVALAQAANGTIRLIHVRSLVPVAYMEFAPATFDLDQQRDAEERLADLAASLPLPAERVSAVVRLGSVYNETLQEAESTGADLIVIGSHRPTMATYLLGSNASTIVRHATCSVLVVRP
jgi:nucleotide-binding universal stress UspA family protein